jgi:hypothetical protein
MAASNRFSTEIPHRIVLTVDVPPRISTKSVNLTVSMFDSRLRFLLGQHLRAQAHERGQRRGERLYHSMIHRLGSDKLRRLTMCSVFGLGLVDTSGGVRSAPSTWGCAPFGRLAAGGCRASNAVRRRLHWLRPLAASSIRYRRRSTRLTTSLPNSSMR